MAKYFIKRFGLMLITFVLIVFIFFVFIKLIPDNHVPPPLGGDDYVYLEMQKREGWDRPIVEQFFLWLRNIFVYHTFGYSHFHRQDVSIVMFGKIPATITFQLIPYLLSIPIGIGLGILAALKKNKTADTVISVGVMIFISVPSFVIAVLFQYIFVWELHIFPSIYVATPSEFAQNFWYGIASFILPTIVITLGSFAGWTRGIRAELTEQLTSDYMLLARSKGLTKTQATMRHALKNAIVPFAPSIFLGFLGLLSGSMIMEQIFRVDGVGKIYLYAFNNKDYPLLMLDLVFYEFIGLLSSILADMSYTLIDPRMRVGSSKLESA
jgi:peptide/nickel transport system permease protein/oligopeptide transport system permease protein